MFFKAVKYAFWATLFGIALSGGVFSAAYYSTLEELPDVAELKHVSFETPMKIYTHDGKLIGEFGEHKRIPVDLDQIPLKMQQAFLAIEDSRFYEHSGVDPVGILRSVVVAVTSGSASQGASTITQQVARNFFLTRDKTIERKIKEIFIAWRIEQVLTKQEILELYLNKIALGHRSYGVVAAAQTYYGKSLKDLSLAEIATIAGLPKAPSTLNPITNPQRAKDRRHLVLLRMLNLGYITEDEFKVADAAPSRTFYHSTPLEAYAPYVAEEARQAVLNKYGEEAYTKGFNIYTTVDSKYQADAHQAIFDQLMRYDVRHGYRGPLLNIFDKSRGARGTLRQAVDKKGNNANVNNGVVMTARKQIAQSYTDAGKSINYEELVKEANYSSGMAAGIDPSTGTEVSITNQDNISIGNTTASAPMSYDDIISLLKRESKYESLDPALVLSVNDAEKSALVLYKDGEQKTLTWEGMNWARAFRNDRSQGEAPKVPSEFLLRGDVIFTYHQSVEETSGRGANKVTETKDLLTLGQLPDVESALIALDPRTGAVRAMSGGFDFEKSKFNRTTQLLRQTGSNFKPFIYSSAIAYGIALNSVIPDEPIKTWDSGSRRWWQPRNSPNRFEGLMTLREGLAKSKNSISIRTIRHVGVENAVEHLRKFDIFVPKFQQSESMALGSVELTPLQVATSYSAFANGGYKLTPYLIDRIELSSGETIYKAHPKVANPDFNDIVKNAIPLEYVKNYQPNERDIALADMVNNPENTGKTLLDANGNLINPDGSSAEPNKEDEKPNNISLFSPLVREVNAAPVNSKSASSGSILGNLDILANDMGPYNVAPQILSHAHAYLIASLMHSNIYGGNGINGPYWGTGSRAARITERDDLQGKTGTTNNVHDAWFSGFNANLVVTTWVGFDNDRDLGYSRARGSESGSATALPIFAEFFKKAQEGVPSSPIPRPKGLTYTKNRDIVEPAIPGMTVIDEGNAASSVQNTGIDSSRVVDENSIF